MAFAGALVALALLLASCGGGSGGDGGGGNSGSGPGLTVSTTSLEITADAGNPFGSYTGTFTITVSNPPPEGVPIGGSFTQNAIVDVSLTPTSATTGIVTIVFQNPTVIGAGTYDDTVTIGICTDDSCTALVGGTRRTINVRYIVTGQPPPQPTVTPSRTQISVERPPFLQTIHEELVTLALQGTTASNVQANTTHTNNAISFAIALPNASGGFDVQITFKPPTWTGIGTFTDTLTVTLCQFNYCLLGLNLNGSPVVITTQYTVSETVSGPNGYTIRQVAATANDVVWDAVGARLYFSTPSSAPSGPNSVVALDPVTLTVGTPAFAGSEPNYEAVSDNGQFLYVGFAGSNSIRRFLLPSLQQDILIPLGNYPSGPLFAGDIQVIPGQPHSVAVSRSANEGFPGGYDVAVFDDAVQRPNAVHLDTAPIPSIQFGASPDVLYGGDGVLTTMGIDGDGVNLASTVNFTLNLGVARIRYDNGSIYTQRGQVIDPVAGALLGSFDILSQGGVFGLAVAPDSGLNRVFFLVSNGGRYEIRAYDMTTFTPIATIPLDGIAFPFNRPLRMIRWGPDGLALPTGDGRILLVTGPFVRPAP